MCPQANIALFEARCKEKIRQFEDAGSDEEDIWDEKDVTFAPESQRRPRSAVAHAHLCLLRVHERGPVLKPRSPEADGASSVSLAGAQAAQTVRRAQTPRKRM